MSDETPETPTEEEIKRVEAWQEDRKIKVANARMEALNPDDPQDSLTWNGVRLDDSRITKKALLGAMYQAAKREHEMKIPGVTTPAE